MRRLFSAFTTTWILVFGAEVLAAGPAAQPTPPTAPAGKAPPAATATPPVEVDGAGKAEALSREHFDKGRRLLVDGACAAAVPEFLESRRLKPSRAATSSAAVCLRKLERYDEALFLMEALLREFVDLPADVKTAAQKEVLDLRALVGTLEIAGAEPGTTVIVNGQVKGEVPLLAPLRLPAGIHLVRLYKEGFEPREVRAEVKGQETTRVSLPLARLLQSGKLRVDEASGAALEVVIDGTAVGRTPWEGPVAVGEHTLSLRGEADLGTVPKTFSIQQNKDVTLSLTAEKLDATLEIAPKPVDASVAVDGIFVGRGAFRAGCGPARTP